ncbi:hypothetical protein GCM10007079_15970 [Nocardiopsis terrae]|nr:hypothetical protein GCM10007079_15970 [Nocardiopsis terrae]
MVLLAALLLPATPVAHAEQVTQEASVEVTIYDNGRIFETGSKTERMAGETSTKLSNGLLSVRANNCNYVRVSYAKHSGTPIDLQFGWFSGNAGEISGTKRNISAEDTVSETWSQVRIPGKVVGYMEVEGQGRYQTPPVSCD